MKSAINLVIYLLVWSVALAQPPQGIPYQAVARNSSGAIMASTGVSIRFSIRDSVATGTILYRETFSVTTSAQGLFSVNIGQGTPVTGAFSGINWGTNSKFLQVELDPAGGSSYIDMGTTQMMSVPYALYSNQSGGLSGVASGGQLHVHVFTVSGVFVTPANIDSSTQFKITVVGGGGSGGRGMCIIPSALGCGCGVSPACANSGCGGGGAGGTAIWYGSGLFPSHSYSVIVGAGGKDSVFFRPTAYCPIEADSGRSSSIDLGFTSVSGTGGKGGVPNLSVNDPSGGSGGQGINGTINIMANNGENYNQGRKGGSSFYNGRSYGSGGNGAACASCVGESGGSGIVIVEW